jgi:hypothetical protein
MASEGGKVCVISNWCQGTRKEAMYTLICPKKHAIDAYFVIEAGSISDTAYVIMDLLGICSFKQCTTYCRSLTIHSHCCNGIDA